LKRSAEEALHPREDRQEAAPPSAHPKPFDDDISDNDSFDHSDNTVGTRPGPIGRETGVSFGAKHDLLSRQAALNDPVCHSFLFVEKYDDLADLREGSAVPDRHQLPGAKNRPHAESLHGKSRPSADFGPQLEGDPGDCRAFDGHCSHLEMPHFGGRGISLTDTGAQGSPRIELHCRRAAPLI
jgi:hypothetical protein